MKSTIGERGQIVIPKQIRDKLGLEKGVILEIEANEDSIVLRPARKKRKNWRDWIGAFEGEGMTEGYLKGKKKEKTREDKWTK